MRTFELNLKSLPRIFGSFALSILLAASLVPTAALSAFADEVSGLEAQAEAEQGGVDSNSAAEDPSAGVLEGSDAGAGSAGGTGFAATLDLGVASTSPGLSGSSSDAASLGSTSDEAADASASDSMRAVLLDLSSGGAVISEGGVYQLPEGAGGVVTVATTEPVTLVGNGVRWDDSFDVTSVPNAELRIDCTQVEGVELTLESVHVTNGACSIDAPFVDFAGEGNVLKVKGAVFLQQIATGEVDARGLPVSSDQALIHVAQGSELSVGGDGRLYLEGCARGALIGGSAGEVNGSIELGVDDDDFALFADSLLSGVIVGSGLDATDGEGAPGAISFVRGSFHMISRLPGAPLGSIGLVEAAVSVGADARVAVGAVVGECLDGAWYETALGQRGAGLKTALPQDAVAGNLTLKGAFEIYEADSAAKVLSLWRLEAAQSSALIDAVEDASADEDVAKVSLVATLDGAEVEGAVVFVDPVTGEPVESMAVKAGERLSLGIQVSNPALYEIEGVYWEYALHLSEEYAVTIDLDNQFTLQDDGTYLSDKEITSDIQVNVRLAERAEAASASATGDGSVTLANRGEEAVSVHAALGDVVTVVPEAYQGSYLAQVRWACVPDGADSSTGGSNIADGADAADGATAVVGADVSEVGEALAFAVLHPDENGAYSFVMPESGTALVYADFISVVWDGSIDVTWYDPSSTYFEIQYAAQYAGLAAIVNGFFTTYPTEQVPIEGTSEMADVPDYDAYKAIMGVSDQVSDAQETDEGSTDPGAYYGEFTATYRLSDSQGASTQSAYVRTASQVHTTRVVGNASFIQLNSGEGLENAASEMLRTTSTYYYGADDFAGKTVEIRADLDFGGRKTASGTWDVESPLFMPVGGQYAMLPGMEKTNGYSILGASWNGVLDGNGHSFSNVYCERYASGGNFGDSVAIGLVGRMGNHDDEDKSKLVKDPTVRQIVFESGYVSGRRSVGAIVGKTGHTTASMLGDGSTGCIVEYCINRADVKSTDKKGVGGIVGAAWNDGVIRYCANFGSVTSILEGGSTTGGIAGETEMLIMNCYSVGDLSAKDKNYACGITTHNGGDGATSNCYWLADDDNVAAGYYYYGFERDNTTKLQSGDALTASMLNTTSAIWVDAEGVNVKDGVSYPALFYQADGYSAAEQYAVTVVQPEVGGTIAATPGVGGFAETVSLSCVSVDPAYVLDYYTLDGQRLDSASFGLDRDCVVSAVFREKKAIVAKVWDHEEAELTVLKDGVAKNAQGELVYVEDYPVSNLDELYEGDVLSYQAQIREGCVPEDSAYEYSGAFNVYNSFHNVEDGLYWTYPCQVYPGRSYTYTVSGREYGCLDISIYECFQVRKNWVTLADTSWYDPDDEQESYEISTPEQLAGAAKLVNGGTADFEGVTIALANDISLADLDGSLTRVWVPMGSVTYAFKGTFDGRGHEVSGMMVDQQSGIAGTQDYVGLIGRASGATVRDVTVSGSVDAASYVGGVVGRAEGCLIEGCESAVDVTVTSSCAGGIVGDACDKTEVSDCQALGSVATRGSASITKVGGVAGYVRGESAVRNCSNTGLVSTADASSSTSVALGVGGIAGEVSASTVEQCLNSGKVVGAAAGQTANAGGIAGIVDGSSVVERCANTGDVEGGAARAGGVAGWLKSGALIDVYNTAVVTSSSGDGVAGGIVGIMYGNTGSRIIEGCYNAGAVAGDEAATLVGRLSSSSNVRIGNAHYLAVSGLDPVGGRASVVGKADVEATSYGTVSALAEAIDALNGEGGAWRADAVGLNSGLPMLSWQLPHTLTFRDTAGGVLLQVGIPEGFAADSALLSGICAGDAALVDGMPAGYSYDFAFWSDALGDGEPLAIDGASANVDAWPSFTRTPLAYSISYDLAGGVITPGANPSTYTVEDAVAFAEPWRDDDMKFLYWADEGGSPVFEISPGSMTGDLKLTAQWAASDVFAVTYRDSSGTVQVLRLEAGCTVTWKTSESDAKAQNHVVAGDFVVPDPEDEPKAGYATIGYAKVMSGDNVVLTPMSGSPISYAIIYDAAGGSLTAGSPTSFTVETRGLAITAPVRDAYVFEGWFDESGRKWDVVNEARVGDLHLTARWSRDLSSAEIGGVLSSYEYTGDAIAPAVTVTHDGSLLSPGADYAVSYERNLEVGVASIVVTAAREGVVGSAKVSFLVTMPVRTDADSDVSISGTALATLAKGAEGDVSEVSLDADWFSYARMAELRSLFSSLGYTLHAGFSSNLEVETVHADGTSSREEVTDGFGTLTLSVPVSAAEGRAVAVYWMSGNSAELVADYLEVSNGRVEFEADTLGDFVVVSRVTLEDIVDEGVQNGGSGDTSASGNSQGVGIQKESTSGAVSSTAKDSSAAAAQSSAAGTVDDLAATTSDATDASAKDGSSLDDSGVCDGCLGCAGPMAGFCDDLCSEESPCPWCSAAPVAGLLVLAGMGVAAWALFMRLRRPKLDSDYGF